MKILRRKVRGLESSVDFLRQEGISGSGKNGRIAGLWGWRVGEISGIGVSLVADRYRVLSVLLYLSHCHSGSRKSGWIHRDGDS